MKLRIPLVLLAALAALAIPAGSALATPVAVWVSPVDGATISQNQTLSVDTNGIANAAGVDFYLDNGVGLGMYIGGYTIWAAHPESAQAAPYSSNGNVYSYQLAFGLWDNGPITINAVVVDSSTTQLGTVSQSATIDNSQVALTLGSFLPLSSGTLSGTLALSLTPSDQNNVITGGTFSVNGDSTQYPLTPAGSGHWSASVDTLPLPNGTLDIEVRFADAAGNTSDDHISYEIANPHAPTIAQNTLVAQKSRWRTDETQLEVGDIVDAYGMQADGYPTPTISYLWNVCHGLVCTGVTPGPDGDYTVQAADEGATLDLIATATNASGSASRTVEFGVIAPAYVYPFFDGGFADGPQFGDAPPAPEPTPAPPVVIPPVVTPPVVIPAITPTEQKIIDIAQKTVEAKTAEVETAKKAVDIAVKTVKTVQKKVDTTVKAVSAGTATPTETKKLASTVATLVTIKNVVQAKVQEAKVSAENAVKAKNASIQKADAALKALVAAKTAVATGASTPAEKKRLALTESTLVAAKAAVSSKLAVIANATKQLVVVQAAAAQSIKVAQTKVSVALTAVASSAATTTAKNDLLKVETKLAEAKVTASVKADAAQAAKAKLAEANQKLALQKKAALKP